MKKMFLFGILTTLALLSSGANAAFIKVTTTDDTLSTDGKCSLREAVQNATDDAATYADCTAGSAVAIDYIRLASGTYTLSSAIDLKNGLFSLSGSSADSTSLESDGSDRVLRIDDATVTLSNLTITGGVDPEYGGAGLYASSSNVSVKNCIIEDNTTSSQGAAIQAMFSDLNISGSTIANNSSKNAGAIFSYSSDVIITDSLLANNTASDNGGAIYFNASTLEMINSTISGNTATNEGGAIYTQSGGYFSISNSTITNNSAASGGGLYYNDLAGSYADYHLKSTILSGNTATTAGDNCYSEDGDDYLKSEGYNFFETDTVTDCYVTIDSSDIEDAHSNLKLGALNDNGGNTQTHRLSFGSDAINTGDCESIIDLDYYGSFSTEVITTDQRGYARISNCDIGAYELQATIGIDKK